MNHCKKILPSMRATVLLIATACSMVDSMGQCSAGEISKVIFLDDFGSGSSAGAARPDITEYTYSGMGEGSYTVTDTLGKGVDHWHNEADYTAGDQGGHAMVFKGKSLTSVFLTYQVSDLCPATRYRVVVQASNVVRADFCGTDPFVPLIEMSVLDDNDDSVINSLKGALPLNNEIEWRSLALDFKTGSMSASVSIRMVNLVEGGGCGNAWAIDDLEIKQVSELIRKDINLCVDSVLVTSDGAMHNQPGIVFDSVKISGTCEYIYTCYALAFGGQLLSTDTLRGCSGDQFAVGDRTYANSGLVYDTLSPPPCLVVRPVYLDISDVSLSQQIVDLCPGDSLQVGSHWYFEQGTYQDTLSSSQGCDSIVETVITSGRALVEVYIGGMQIINNRLHVADRNGIYRQAVSEVEIGSGIELEVSLEGLPEAQVKWSGLGSFHCDTCSITAWDLAASGVLRLEVVSQDLSCDIVFEIEMLPSSCEPFYIPNAFSPNGDGINDRFIPIPQSCVEEGLELSIYNRWGNLLHRSTEELSWDGSRGSQEHQRGVYLYVLKARLVGGTEVILEGTVTKL